MLSCALLATRALLPSHATAMAGSSSPNAIDLLGLDEELGCGDVVAHFNAMITIVRGVGIHPKLADLPSSDVLVMSLLTYCWSVWWMVSLV